MSEMIKQPWENPRDNEVLPGTFHGMRAGSKLLEDRQIGIFEETRRGTEARDQQLQSHCLDVGDVQVVCHLYCHRLCEMAWEVSGRSVWSTHPPTASIQKMKMVATNIRSTHGHNQHIFSAPKERVHVTEFCYLHGAAGVSGDACLAMLVFAQNTSSCENKWEHMHVLAHLGTT